MIKKLLFLILMLITTSSIYASNNSKFSFETQIGFSSEKISYSFVNQKTSLHFVKQNSNYIGEKVKYNYADKLNLVLLASYRFCNYSQYISMQNPDTIFSLEKSFNQNSLSLFVGIEREFDIVDNLTLTLESGINTFYFYENESRIFIFVGNFNDSALITYGFSASMNLYYNVHDNLKVSLGFNALYNPIVKGKGYDYYKSYTENLDGTLNVYVSSFTPSIGITYIL